ncbi:HD-ZIP IV family of homeobox-leucine zipper protein with lipid-binding START domain-containing protein isoform X2 [Wolffia australiana]
MTTPRNQSSPALSLSLAGVYRNAGSVGEEAEVGDEGSGSAYSENAEEEEYLVEEEGDMGRSKNTKKRRKYHRHTPEQIKEMEALFKESPHPDEKQRQELSDRLGLAPRQVKFWFQNRRTQMKTLHERHENSLMKSEMEKLREENRSMREKINNYFCPKGTTDAQMLRIENARLRSENEKLREILGNCASGRTITSSFSANQEKGNPASVDYYRGFSGVEKSKILEHVEQATVEMTRLATTGEPLWVKSLQSGREILNYEEYLREFSGGNSANLQGGRYIEASRETGVVILDVERLVKSFIDANQWKDMFPCMISKAVTVDIISSDEGGIGNGAVHLMFAELQMLTPMVPTREVYFVRGCRQLSSNIWAVVDVSPSPLEGLESKIKCRRLPSGCIIEDKSSGHCKVTWVEHVECHRGLVHAAYRPVVSSGVAFGAWHWMATLQLHWMPTLAGRKSTLKLAQRVASSFCRAISASSSNSWMRISTNKGDDVRISARKNISDPGEPPGLILTAVSSFWLPIPAATLFNFLRDDSRRSEWDVLPSGGRIHTVASVPKGQDRANSVAIKAAKSDGGEEIWFLEETCTNSFESMLVYARVAVERMKAVMNGCDSDDVAALPSGFSILPDGLEESTPVTITSFGKAAGSGGALVTVAFQLVADDSPAAKLTMDSAEAAGCLISSSISHIRRALRCVEG